MINRQSMTQTETQPVDQKKIKAIIAPQKNKMNFLLSFCVHCGLCAESCFLYQNHKNPKYVPAYKAIHSLGRIYKKKGAVDRNMLEEIKTIIWEDCVLCERCYCPLGIDIPALIALARSICRSQGVYGVFPHSCGEP